MSINQTKLKEFFPNIRTRLRVLEIIRNFPELSARFDKWRVEQQEQFLDICCGARGVKMLYDVYFKEILSPEATPGRLSDFLTCLMGRKVIVRKQLPNDTIRIADELSLVITDIVVELDDGTLANVEVQRIGYLFLGERASCYSSDMLLRQYKRVRDEQKEKFSYKDVAPVYTIVFMETSPAEFHEFPDAYVHKFVSESDTGLELNLLQNFIFIPVDIFLAKLHNKGIENKFDAWLTFLGCDEIEYIEKLINEYPEFRPMYKQLYDMCLNVEGVMQMFSEELAILDRNTAKLMIDEYQEAADKAVKALEAEQEKTKALQEENAEQKKRIAELEARLAQQ